MPNHASRVTLHALLDVIKEKYLSPSDFWTLYLESRKAAHLITVNVEILKALQQDPHILHRADGCTIDSALLQRAMTRIYGRPFERLTGREIVEKSPDHLSSRGVLLFGASDEARRRAIQKYRAVAPIEPHIYGFNEPTALASAVSPRLKMAGFFAYGYPKQERRIEAFRALNPDVPSILIGVGGAIDYFAGVVPRPPELVSRTGFEWLWRLLIQPRARFRRIAATVPFALRLLAYSHRHRPNR